MSNLFVSGVTILQGASTHISSLNVSGTTNVSINTTILGSFNVSRNVTLANAITINSTINVSSNVYAPNLDNKSAIMFTCGSSLVLNGTTYFKYDIDLTKYTTSIALPLSAGYVRKFRIYAWLASSDFRPSTNRFDENQYSIFMSNIQPGPVYTIRAYGIGAGLVTDNYYLNKIPSMNSPGPTFLLSNSYNYLTYVGPRLGTFALVVIIDEF